MISRKSKIVDKEGGKEKYPNVEISVIDNTVSLQERQIPTVGKGTLASVADGKGTLVPFGVFCRRKGGAPAAHSLL